MALTSELTKTVPVPHEQGQSFTIRKLSHHHVSMARDRARDRALELMRQLGDIKLPEPKDAPPADPAAEYDRGTVLTHGITGWTYSAPCDETHIADLDEETADWAFREVLAFSVRTAAEGKASASDSPDSTDPAEVVGLPS